MFRYLHPPNVFLKLMEVLHSNHTSAEDIATVISSDPCLSARLLQIVNGSLYSFPSVVDTISRAVIIVGAEQICDLAVGTYVIKKFNEVAGALVDMEKYWCHSFACGLIARSLAIQKCARNIERFFGAGLLYDIGRLVLFLREGNAITRVLNSSLERKTCLEEEDH